MTYDEFIERKLPRVHHAGFKPSAINPMLFDWQQEIVKWAVRIGRAALFEDCGLGKTPQQLEWARQVVKHTGKPVLGLCPLAVAEQTIEESRKFGIEARHCRTLSDFGPGINYTNYERLHLFESVIEDLAGVICDESSILKNFAGKTSGRIIQLFSRTPYRLCCTATPAPNDYEELGTHAEFLGYGTRMDMLSTYFIHDSANTADWRLKKHARRIFWEWVSTWAACLSKPSDIGYSDDGFILPPLNIETIQVEVSDSDNSGDELFRLPSMSGITMHKEMRLTCSERVKAAAEIVNARNGDPVVIWCNTNYEADELKKALPDAIEVRGSDSPDDKEKRLFAFTTGRESKLITKPDIAGFGLNWQHCNVHVFVGLSYSFENFYQAIRRGYRFGQKRPFTAYIIHAQTEGAVKDRVFEKMQQHDTMKKEMKQAAKSLLLTSQPKPKMNTALKSSKGANWELFNGDCVRVAKTLPDDSVGFSVYSPPFASLYVYSDEVQDMGNCPDDDVFFEQYAFLIKEKFRITKPGRLSAVHCMDLPTTVQMHGYTGLRDFSGRIIKEHEDAGWIYHCRITIWKDPVVAMQRTKAIGLLWKQLRKDSCKSRVGFPDYVLVFKKPGENQEEVEHTHESFPVEDWQKIASPVWMDIEQTNVLNRDGAKEQNDERHICPLQLDVIRRALRLWSNPGDVVYSPFAGIGSEGHCAIEMKRKFIGSELKKSYYDQAVAFLKRAEAESVSLFDFNAGGLAMNRIGSDIQPVAPVEQTPA